ncbi:hypothetical protein ACKF11_13305 [Methylobacillus sp. Pita2]|uniref:hypothetical protein n=1 Tax=Methylobacillus sp. Pita2 TaxID=3383245 RepID=UPI0038B56AFF
MSATPNSIPIHYSLGAFPRFSPWGAANAATEHDALGIVRTSADWQFPFSAAHMQICPQNRGQVNPYVINHLREAFPNTVFRLHANVHLLDKLRIIDLDTIMEEGAYLEALKACQAALGHPIYSLHPGSRKGRPISWLTNQAARLQDLLGAKVAIEGMYPSREHYFLSTWREYEALFKGDAYFALDFSHIKILGERNGYFDHNLVKEMLQSGRCLEVHLSENDGQHDQHVGIDRLDNQFWLEWVPFIGPETIIFSEEHYSTFMEKRAVI